MVMESVVVVQRNAGHGAMLRTPIIAGADGIGIVLSKPTPAEQHWRATARWRICSAPLDTGIARLAGGIHACLRTIEWP